MRHDFGSIAAALTLCATAGIGSAQPVSATNAAVPSALKPPAGTMLIERLAASGSQVYVCAPGEKSSKPQSYAWTLKAPDAVLRAADGKSTIRHYAGPTWEARDGSKVVGKLVATRQAPAKGAVPWLLLSATETGAGTLAGIRYVQRLDTVGGAAPAGSCVTLGEETRVPYTADYAFYR